MENIDNSQSITLNDIPTGNYSAIEFMVGVDSARNTAPIQNRQGVLDPSAPMMDDGMYWAWNSGYIFVKLEGISSLGNTVNKRFYYHIGLFGGYKDRTVNNTRIVKLDFFNVKVNVTANTISKVNVLVDVLKFFDGPSTNLSIAKYNSMMGGQPEKSQEIANNYAKMFILNNIH